MNNQNYKLAYIYYLLDYDFRDLMLKCGEHSMMTGAESENVILLACASSDSDSELVNTFTKAAKEIGLDLPNRENSILWLAETVVELTESGVEVPNQDLNENFKRNLLVAYTKLATLTLGEPSLEEFCFEFGKLVEITGLIDNYEDWRVGLNKLCESVESSKFKKVAERIVGLVNWVSYGATTKEHLLESHRIALSLLKEQ